MATIRFRRALLGNMTEFLRVGAISAEIVEFSGEQRNDSPPGSNKFRMVYENAAGRIYGLKYGSCRFCSGLIRPRAQTCMDSKVVRADFAAD